MAFFGIRGGGGSNKNHKVVEGVFVSSPNQYGIVNVVCGFRPDLIIVALPFTNNDTVAVWWNKLSYSAEKSLWALAPSESVNYAVNLGRASGETGIQQINADGFSFMSNGGNTRGITCKYIAIKFYSEPFPHGYTLFDYIKSDGSAWINTGLRFTTNTKFEIKGRWTTTSLSSEFFFGIWQSLKESELGYESGSLVYLMGGTGKYQSFTPDTNSHVISSDANGIYVDGVSVGTPTWANVSTGFDIPIFARSVTGTIRSNEITSHFELEYCKIWQNDALVRDFVPCINDDTSVIGLYDKANDVFYTNAGSGSFIAGDPI